MKTSLFGNTLWDVVNTWNDMMLTDAKYRGTDNLFEELEDEYICKVNMAGIKKENIKVILEGNLLKVSAEQDGHKYRTSVYVPKKVDLEGVSIKYEDGILYLNFKKKPEHKAIELKIS